MEENNKQLKSIWGKWWEPFRKWFYPSWLLYETTIRFSDYAHSIHTYFIQQQDNISSYIGEIGAQTLDVFCSILTFAICAAFLTLPACFVLHKFFKTDNLTGTQFENKMKPFF
ncbi:hypothetical protein [Aquimarina sediminis]|uniref:hypothetical protein n=1 Tax=Aquimarina sediminis TaxID=2070536 RepID=UPI000CA0345F|nr:hypothetical protein [Aquimarina sediminis]